MNILLVQSYLGRKEKEDIYPLGLIYLKNALRDQNVAIYDPNVDKNPFPDGLIKVVKETCPEVVGISLRNVDTTLYADRFLYYKTLKTTLRVIKEIPQDIKIIIGSTAFSMFAEEIMKRHPAIDFGFYLEAEESLPELLDHLHEPEKVSGIFFRRGNKVVFTGKRKPPNFAKLPMPIRDVALLKKYSGPGAVGIQAKRGCVMNCLYCTYPFLSGSRLRMRSPSDVVDEIEYLLKEHGLKHLAFVDPVFNCPASHAADICREIIRREVKFNWGAWYNEHHLDEELVKLSIEAGCDCFCFSPDSITQMGLKTLKKDITPEDIQKVYRIARRHPKMRVMFNFFAFPPGQGLYHFLILIIFFLRCKLFLRKRLLSFGVGTIRVEPNTRAESMAIKDGLIEPGDSLLPETDHELERYFYILPSTRLYIRVLEGLRVVYRVLRKTTRVILRRSK